VCKKILLKINCIIEIRFVEIIILVALHMEEYKYLIQKQSSITISPNKLRGRNRLIAQGIEY